VNEKTSKRHWDTLWERPARLRHPTSLHVGIRNLRDLLKGHVRPGSKYLEIGCAPGNLLAWVRHKLRADVSGLDYSEPGIAFARRLFDALGLAADLRCEDVFKTSFEPGSFDVVFSAGVIEHFDDPRDLVAEHVKLLAKNGVALITVPNYGGWLGRVQGRLDPENLAIHNVGIMNPTALRALAPAGSVAKAYPFGRFSPWVLSLKKGMPSPLAFLAAQVGNLAGLVQPVHVGALAPLLVLEIRRAE
jgi:2-polyprenyl-3-methyl-5-hydroxy-6-metoxy-1,4-benzoquinol methylase